MFFKAVLKAADKAKCLKKSTHLVNSCVMKGVISWWDEFNHSPLAPYNTAFFESPVTNDQTDFVSKGKRYHRYVMNEGVAYTVR